MRKLVCCILVVLGLVVVTEAFASCEVTPRLGLKTNGLAVQFTDKSKGEIKAVEWDFGDGFTSKKANPVHRYSKAGAYNFTLTVTSLDGCDKAFEGKVYVFDVKKKPSNNVQKKEVKPQKAPIEQTASKQANENLPASIEHISTLRNYPNPFSTTTTIAFELTETTHVNVQVMDITGKLVRILANETLNSGEHKVAFDRDNLASGTYLINVVTDAQSVTHKAVIQ